MFYLYAHSLPTSFTQKQNFTSKRTVSVQCIARHYAKLKVQNSETSIDQYRG